MKHFALIFLFSFALNQHINGQFEQVYPQEFVSSISEMVFHDSGLAIAVLECDGILRSTDHGTSWTYVPVPGMSSQNNIIFIDNDPNKVLISGSYAGYQSKDGGLSFEPLSYQGVKSDGLRRQIVQLANGKFLFLCRLSSSISDDLVTWEKLEGLSGSYIAMDGNTFYTVSGRVVIKSTNNAATYDTVYTETQNILGVNYKDGNLYISLLDGSVLLSKNGGQTFNEINTPELGFGNLHVYSKDHFVFFYHNSVAYTLDGGATYTKSIYDENRIAGMEDFAIRGDGKIFVYGESLKMLTSVDQGQSWIQEKGRNENFICIGVNQNLVAVGGNEGSMAYSEDGGKIWKNVTFGAEKYVTEILPIGPNKIYFYSTQDMIGTLIDYNGKAINNHQFEKSIFALQYFNNRLFAIESGTKSVIHVSADEGGTWNPLATINYSIYNIDFINNNEWLASASNGVFLISTDQGKTWTTLFDVGENVQHASFKNKNEVVYFSNSNMKGTNDGFANIEVTSKPYNAVALARIGEDLYCLGANGSNTFMYNFTGLLANKGMQNGCVAHSVIATTPSGVVIAGKGKVIEFFENKSSSVRDEDAIIVEKIKVSPNPADQTIFIEGINDVSEVIIFDILGNKFSTISKDQQIDISKLSTGIYHFSVKEDNRLKMGKFVKI